MYMYGIRFIYLDELNCNADQWAWHNPACKIWIDTIVHRRAFIVHYSEYRKIPGAEGLTIASIGSDSIYSV